jgi:hypothetical protein
VVVSFTDVSGVTRTVGPPGGAVETEDSTLTDSDPENPLNKLGIKKWAHLSMGTSTIEGATAVGRIFLQEQKQLDSAGEAQFVGHVMDDKGVYWPAWMVRAGDQIAFVDSRDSRYRRVIKTSYDDSTRTCSVNLDQPVEALPELLERLAVSIQNV